MTTPPAPARLFVLLARSRQSHVGVIFRRGPTAWVQMIHWNTKNDIFTPGQWFKGKIHVYKSDLSPNGKLLIYLASKSGNSYRNPGYGNMWTAISKPPYFTALGLWPYNEDSDYGGGGYFWRNDQVWVNHLNDRSHPNHQPKHITVRYPDEFVYKRGLYYHLLRLRHWNPLTLRDPAKYQKPSEWRKGVFRPAVPAQHVWYKESGNIRVTQLIYGDHRRTWSYGYPNDFYAPVLECEYGITISPGDDFKKLDGVTWADFDHRSRLVLAKEGKLFSAAVSDKELTLTELADFNANKPEQVKTPGWARRW